MVGVKAIIPGSHEYAANYLYNQNGLTPYFACDSRVKDGDGSQVGEFTDKGQRWVVRLSYQSSNLIHPGRETPLGTDFQLYPDTDTSPKTLRREFRLAVARHPEEDPLNTTDKDGQQVFVARLAPRWPGMKGLKKNGLLSHIPVPHDFGEGVNVRVDGSNIEFTRYSNLIALGFGAVGVRSTYFSQYSPSSNVQDAERYVRIHRDESGPVHARDGAIAQLGHLLENDRDGRRDLKQWDTDDHGRQLPGYLHTVILGPRRISEAWPSHELPKEVKHYYAREAFSKPESDPLAHPKVGASYQVSRWDETLYVNDLDRLNRELTETVRSVLMDSAIDLAPVRGHGPYISDAYWTPEFENTQSVTELNLTQIRHDQESIVIRHLVDGGFSPVEWECLNTLVTNGGKVSPLDLANENNRHVDSVRRALRRIDEIVDRKYGEIGLRSNYIAELVHSAVVEARQSVQTALSAGAKAIQAADRGLSETMAKWIAWCERYDVDIRNRSDAMEIDLGDLDPDRDPAPSFLIQTGFQVWKDAEQDPVRFRRATVRYNGMMTRAFELLR